MKILLIRFSSLGDIVMTTPIIRAIEMQLNAEIHFITKRSFADVIKYNVHLSKLFIFDNQWKEHKQELISENYDLVVDLHSNRRTYELKLALGKPSAAIKKMYLRKWIYILFKINTYPKNHVVDRSFEDLKQLQITNDNRGMQVYIDDRSLSIGREIVNSLIEKEKKVVAIVVGTAHVTKTISKETLINFINSTDYTIVLLGGKNDESRAREIELSANRPIKNLAGSTSILESAAIIQFVDLVITGDTGMMHIAASFAQNIIVIYGATTPPFGMYPYTTHPQRIRYMENDIWCRPCSSHGTSFCPLGHHRCMTAHTSNQLMEISKDLLKLNDRTSLIR